MDLQLYKPTELEQWIAAKYQEHRIFYAHEMDLDFIADIFNAEIRTHSKETNVIWDEEFSLIYLCAYLSNEQKREAFFHELGHIVRHVGNQRRMPEGLIQIQENEANVFQLYAAMPIYMLEEFWDAGQAIYPKVLAQEFVLPVKLVLRRLEQIQNRIFWEKSRLERIRKQEEAATIKITEDHVRKVMEEYGRLQREERRA